MTSRQWRPIAPLVPQPNHGFSAEDDLRRQWTVYQLQAGDASLTALHRSWAIETGIIEGIYQLDEAQTRTLIEQGFEPENIPQSGTGQDPENLLAILQDHMTALDAIYSEVQRGRSIGRSAIRQLHQVVVAHQPTYRAMNQFGQWFDATLHAGAFKTLPNNPTRPDGVIHEYCPPIHVESEIDNLLGWYADYCAQPDAYHPYHPYHPLVVAAWLHHRFAQIHPFPDGNGRVTRALVSWHLVQHGYLPIVVTHHDRNSYIDSLEVADDGDLIPLVNLTAGLQRRAMLQAISNCDNTRSQRA